MTMISLILVSVLFGIILYKVPLKVGKALLLLVQGYLGFTAIFLFLQSRGEALREILGGANNILYIELYGDQVALTFVCLTIFIFTVALLYSCNEAYFSQKFMLLLLILQGLTIGIFLTDDIFNLFILMEVSTLVVVLLIMFKKEFRCVYDGLYYLMIQIVAMLFFLFGIAYLYRVFGVLSITEMIRVLQLGADIPAQTLLLPFAFLMTGICLKIGFFPLFSWVSRSYGTPSSSFTILMILSGLLVKGNIYVFMRLNELFYPTLDYRLFFLVLAFITGVGGAIKALAQKDIKLILAYSTISQVGLIMIGLFLPNQTAGWGSMYHILNHALFKSLLFLGTGMIVDKYQSRHAHKIRGVFKEMPVVALIIIIAILGITGAPFLNGSISKYWILDGSSGTLLEPAIWIINMGTILVYVKYAMILFGKAPKALYHEQLVAPRVKVSILYVLGFMCLMGGLFGTQIVYFLFDIQLTLSLASLIQKGFIYVVMMLGGAVFYRFFLSKTNKLYLFLEGSLTLPRSCFILLAFFTTLVAYGMLLF